jgi:predicted GIY-YIG superfamily endonuclease
MTTTRTTTWPAQIAVVLVLMASGMASGANGFLSWNSPLGENVAEASHCQEATSISGELHRGCGELSQQDAAELFVAPKTGESVYVHKDAEGKVNYIGISDDPPRRAGEHRLDPEKTGETMETITDPLTHDQARTIEGKLIRERLREAKAKGLIDGTEPIEEQLRKADLLNKSLFHN